MALESENKKSTFEIVRDIVAKTLSIDESKVTKESDFLTDLGADSIDLVEIYMGLEDEYQVSIPDSEIPNIKTVGDLVEFVDTKMA